MKYKESNGVRFSRLSLGTVQLGINYGINNKTGKPSRDDAFIMLNKALEGGINALDTAAAYGDSESVIGEWLKTLPHSAYPFISTKVANLDHTSLLTLRESMHVKIEKSKEHLGISQIPLLMLHNYEEYSCDVQNMRKVFYELKENGDIRFSGISAYAHHDYRVIAESGFDAAQIPCNIFDWRQIDNGGIDALKNANMMIFVRSVYLQGLIFLRPEKLDNRMNFCRETLIKFQELCQSYHLQPAELALSFALSLPGVTSLVLGSENVTQVQNNLSLIDHTVELTKDQMGEIRERFHATNEKILTPSMWYNS